MWTRIRLLNHFSVARRLAAGLAQLDHAAAGAVGGRHEQQVIRRRPDRRADVEAPVGLVRMGPQRLPGRGIEPDDYVAAEVEQLLLAVHVDDRSARRARVL